MNTISKRAVVLTAALAVALPGAAIAKSSDRDGDGMPNRWETSNGLRVSQNDAARDADRDDLTNLREYRLRTNPRSADTDRDGLEDGAERRSGTNPRDRDSDNDGVTDGNESAAADEGSAAGEGSASPQNRGARDCPEDGQSEEQPQS